MKKQWVFDPHSGGVKISTSRKAEVKSRIERYAKEHFQGKCDQVKVVFRSELCYVYAIKINSELGTEEKDPLCRLRHFDINKWSFSFFTWSSEKYEPCLFPTGGWFGDIDECMALGSSFLI